jgi:hypothetical protein
MRPNYDDGVGVVSEEYYAFIFIYRQLQFNLSETIMRVDWYKVWLNIFYYSTPFTCICNV